MVGNDKPATIGGLLPSYYLEANIPRIYIGTAAPATTPTKLGDIYVDSVTGYIYMAKQTSDANGWSKVN